MIIIIFVLVNGKEYNKWRDENKSYTERDSKMFIDIFVKIVIIVVLWLDDRQIEESYDCLWIMGDVKPDTGNAFWISYVSGGLKLRNGNFVM